MNPQREAKKDVLAFYRRAMERLSPEEKYRERDRTIPYSLSLHALALPVFEAGRRQGWQGTGLPMAAAVSGGGDSAALLWLLRIYHEGPLFALHVNHGIRGRASDEDRDFVRALAEGWGIPFQESQVSVPDEMERGESLEAAARRLRYRELEVMAGRCGAHFIALGHNRDDLAETVLFNLLRGTGGWGAIGMPERRGPFVRPLLGFRREFLRKLLRVRGLSWREDASNEDRTLTRNFMRLELFPLVEDRINTGAVEHLAAFAEEMRERRQDEARRSSLLLAESLVEEDPFGLTLSRKELRSLSGFELSLVVREAARRLGLSALSRRRTVELVRLVKGEGPFLFLWEEEGRVWCRGPEVSFAKGQKDRKPREK